MVSANELIDASVTSIADARREILKFGFSALFFLAALWIRRANEKRLFRRRRKRAG
jgi:hypothetical protein